MHDSQRESAEREISINREQGGTTSSKANSRKIPRVTNRRKTLFYGAEACTITNNWGGGMGKHDNMFFKASVRIMNELSDEVRIELGVGQGCVASPTLSNVSMENLFKPIININDVNAGETKYNNLRHAYHHSCPSTRSRMFVKSCAPDAWHSR